MANCQRYLHVCVMREANCSCLNLLLVCGLEKHVSVVHHVYMKLCDYER